MVLPAAFRSVQYNINDRCPELANLGQRYPQVGSTNDCTGKVGETNKGVSLTAEE